MYIIVYTVPYMMYGIRCTIPLFSGAHTVEKVFVILTWSSDIMVVLSEMY